MVPWSNALVDTRSGKSALRPLSSRILPTVALGIAVVVSLSGCGGDANSEPTDDPTEPSASSSPEYVPASADGPAQNVPVPELPDEAHEQTAEGAEAALKHWWDTLEYLYLTGDASPMAQISDTDCAICNHMTENWTGTYEEGEWLSLEASLEIDIVETATAAENSQADVEYEVDHPRLQLHAVDGSEVEGRSTKFNNQAWTGMLNFDEQEKRWIMFDTIASDRLEGSDDVSE